MESKGIKKILLLGIVLLIVAGIVVVALKGFKVSLILQKHESISLIVGKEVVLDLGFVEIESGDNTVTYRYRRPVKKLEKINNKKE